jgi:hypothetical protein
MWLKWYSACLASPRLGVQTLMVLQKQINKQNKNLISLWNPVTIPRLNQDERRASEVRHMPSHVQVASGTVAKLFGDLRRATKGRPSASCHPITL